MAKWLIIFILFNFASCGKYYKFDQLYFKNSYYDAYQLLKQNPSTSIVYKEREIKVLLFLAIQDTGTYLPLLDNALLALQDQLPELNNLSRSWIQFISAETTNDYQNISSQLPKIPFEDSRVEHLRLLMLTHSLARLGQYQEAIAYLQSSDLTKTSSDLLYIKGTSHFTLKQNSQAKESFTKLIEVSQNDGLKSLAYFYLGNIATEEQSIKDAEEYYLNAWNLDPYNAELNFLLGKTLQNYSYSDIHYRFYRASLRLNENLAEAWYRLNI